MLLKERNHSIVEQVSSHQGVLAVVELGKGRLRVGVDKRLLVDTTNTLEVANVEGILGTKISRMFGLDLALGEVEGSGSRGQAFDLAVASARPAFQFVCNHINT